MQATRYDTAPISKVHLDAQTGYLIATDVPIARVGVFPYRRADGSFAMEAKLPQELLNDSTVSSANNKSVTDGHPSEMVTVKNAAKLAKGWTASNAHVDGDMIKVDIAISDPGLIQQINDGKEELSIGFQTDIAPTSGSFRGMRYDAVQTNININHIAVVFHGRAGHNVRLTGDSAIQDEDFKPQGEGGQTVETTHVRLDETDVEVAVNDAKEVSKASSKIQQLTKEVADKQAELDNAKEELAKAQEDAKSAADNKKEAKAQKAKADEKDKTIGDLQKQVDELKKDSLDDKVEERLNLITKAKPFLEDGYDFKGKSDKQIKLDAIKAQDKDFKEDSADDNFIDGFFNAMQAIKPAQHNGHVGLGGRQQLEGDSNDALTAAYQSRMNLRGGKK